MTLEREIETYRRKLPELLADKGKFVVIHGEEVAGIFDGYEDALTVGYERYGSDAFLVRKISDTEQTLNSPRRMQPCPLPPSHSERKEQS